MCVKKTRKVKSADDTVEESNDDDNDEPKVEDVNDDEKESKDKPEEKVEEYYEYDRLNENNVPLWEKNNSEVTEPEYEQLYKTLSNDNDTYLTKVHFKAEGKYEFSCILYVPKHAPFDLFQKSRDEDDTKVKDADVRLYVKRVAVPKCYNLVPEWMSFVKGVVNCNDLPLNVSREMLQQNSIVSTIKKQITKKVIDMLSDLQSDDEKYKQFYEEYSKTLKYGVHLDDTNRERLVKLLRFTSLNNSDGSLSMTQYVESMKPEQKDIYYLTGSDKNVLYDSPFLEGVKKRGFDVLLLFESIDAYLVNQVRNFSGKDLKNLSKEGLKFDDTEHKNEEHKKLFDFIKEVLGDSVNKVVSSNLLEKSPCVVTTHAFSWDANMQRIMNAQALSNDKTSMYMAPRKTLEMNVNHCLVKLLIDEVNKVDKSSDVEPRFKDLVRMMYDTALLTSGFTLDKPAEFANKIHRLLSLGFGAEETTSQTADDLPELVESNDATPQEKSNMEDID